MPRPREFDYDEVLDRAMQRFWGHGYEATSVQDLVQVMGINRASIYNTFGDKRRLYLAVLERYQNQVVAGWLDQLDNADDPRVAIRSIFEAAVESSILDAERRGCLIVNAAVEMAPRDSGVDAYITRNLSAIEEGFYRALCQAQQRGEVDKARDVRALARFLVNNLEGLFVLARATPDRPLLDDIVSVTLSILG